MVEDKQRDRVARPLKAQPIMSPPTLALSLQFDEFLPGSFFSVLFFVRPETRSAMCVCTNEKPSDARDSARMGQLRPWKTAAKSGSRSITARKCECVEIGIAFVTITPTRTPSCHH